MFGRPFSRIRDVIDRRSVAGIGRGVRAPWAALVGLIALCVSPGALAAPIRIADGLVSGSAANGVLSFKGLPYAAPPVGPLRWRAPQPAIPWTGVKDASQFGPACMQPAAADLVMSEDCLTLNIFRPDDARRGLPVMVWIHGGGLAYGSSATPSTDGAAFARRGVLLVSLNYRLGPFGYFAHPALTAENADGGRLGNYGLMDQIAALQWIRRNIAVFGGDPNHVTIFGQSAGALSVEALMIAPQARGLFQGAIAQSGYAHTYPDLRAARNGFARSAEDAGAAFIARLGLQAKTAADLRAIPAATLNSAHVLDVSNGLMIDGTVLTQGVFDAFEMGAEAKVPFVVGSNEVEYTQTTRPIGAHFWPEPQGADRARILAAYGGDERLMTERLLGDTNFAAQARYLARRHAKAGAPAYVYRFCALPTAAQATLKGAPHGFEIPYVFDTLQTEDWPVDAADHAVANSANAAWAVFGRTGVPTAKGQAWPRVETGLILTFTREGPRIGPDPLAPRLDAIEAAW
jgi:para-nitrobenzyl esterase